MNINKFITAIGQRVVHKLKLTCKFHPPVINNVCFLSQYPPVLYASESDKNDSVRVQSEEKISNVQNVTVPDHWEDQTHIPVMVNEILEMIKPKSNQIFLDMTYGGGGHTKALLDYNNNITVFALDRDPDSYEHAKAASKLQKNIIPLQGKFSEVHHLLAEHDISPGSLDGVLFDVGASSFHFDISERGFSISKDGPLDMRMNKNREPGQPTAADVVNGLDEHDLYKIIKIYGEEKMAKRIARTIVEYRLSFGRITTTQKLASVVESAFVRKTSHDKLMRHSHVATRTFQALRVFVNNEFNELHNGLGIVYDLLKPGGICVAISFHSLEDRIVKRIFHGIDMDDKFNKTVGDHRRKSRHEFELLHYSSNDIRNLLIKKWSPVSKKVATPTDEEVQNNPRARSAKLRASIKQELYPS